MGDGWIEAVVRIAKALGFNPVRVRWKLRRWRTEGAAGKARWRARSETRVCPHCGAVQPMDAGACESCGKKMGLRALVWFEKIGLALPKTGLVSALLGLVIVAVYVRMIVASGGQGLMGFDIFTLMKFGARTPDTFVAREYWRLGTPILLHIGLWHLGFNLFALSQIGPPIEEVFGRARMLFFFLVTGILANLGALWFGPYVVSAGASGSLMGLIGVAAAWGHQSGTASGRELRDRMAKWAAYTMIFGFFLGADNWAHGVGFVVGALLGVASHPERGRGQSRALVALGVASALLTAMLAIIAIVPYAPRFKAAPPRPDTELPAEDIYEP